MRRQFQLPRADAIALDATKLRWETIRDRDGWWVAIYDRPIPSGFNVSRIDMAAAILPLYPDVQIDSVLVRPCPRPLRAPPLSHVGSYRMDGREWFHLCRHRSKENPWRPGVDDLATHLALVDQWLIQSLGRRP